MFDTIEISAICIINPSDNGWVALSISLSVYLKQVKLIEFLSFFPGLSMPDVELCSQWLTSQTEQVIKSFRLYATGWWILLNRATS